MDILNLANLRAISLSEAENHHQIDAVGGIEPTTCPTCHSPLYRHGTQAQVFMDAPIRGKPVKICIDRRRFRCRICGKTLFEPLPEMDAKRNMTERLVAYVEGRCLKETFAHVSREVGVDNKTIRLIFDDYVSRLKQKVTYETPEVMGIDEIKIIGEYRATLTNIQALSLFDLLPTRKKSDLLTYFDSLPNKDKIKIVTMDLWNVYRQVVTAKLPKRMIVADRFHVVRMANNALEAARKKVRRSLEPKSRIKLKNERFVLLKRRQDLSEAEKDKLQHWVELFPALGEAYNAKEGFFDIYEQPTRAAAERAARLWMENIPASVEKEFREPRVALYNWWNEIFAWYDFKVTNAYTESINRLAKDVNRMGRGYSFDVIRAKLLFDQEARKPTTRVVRKRVRKEMPEAKSYFCDCGTSTRNSVTTKIEERRIEYGPHIPTLCRLLEEGHFD